MLYPHRYGAQVERYIGQFMRVFSKFQVKDGVTRDGSENLKRVPCVYGNMSRVVASVLQKRGTFQSNRLPMMAVNMRSLEVDRERRKADQHVDTVAYNVANTQSYYQRLVGPAFNMNMELSVWASSTTELFNIVEQILLIFNPRVTIQVDNQVANSDYITQISLESIQPEIQYPMGTETPAVMLTLEFSVPIRLRYPHDDDGSYMDQITLNIFQATQESVPDIPLDQVIIDGDDVQEIN